MSTRYPRLRHGLERLVLYLMVVAVVSIVALPLLWMLISSLKPSQEVVQYPPTILPANWTLDSYHELFATTNFETYFLNSTIVAVGSTVFSVTVGSLGAYSLARFKYFGMSTFARSVLLAYMAPSILLVIPLFLVIIQLGLMDTRLGLIVASTTFTLPVSLWFMRSYFRAIPIELEESAMIDGASRLRALWSVTLPLASPGALSVGLFVFAHAWNEFLFALVFVSSDGKKTLPVGLQSLITENQLSYWGTLLAGGVLVTVPVIVLYAFVQRHIVSGLGAGALKS